MTRSMTGFGSAQCQAGSHEVKIEIRCLNSKQLDLNTRLPSIFREYEHVFRAEIARGLYRGKVDLHVTIESSEDQGLYTINIPLAQKYHDEILQLAKELQLDPPRDPLTLLTRLPEVFKSSQRELSEEEWNEIMTCFREAMKAADGFRLDEGKILEKDLRTRVGLVLDYLAQVEPMEAGRIQHVRQRIQKNLEEVLQGSLPDQNRFEQEMIYYLERFDISEEKTRLGQHCQHFLTVLHSDEQAGKKLGFIAQEMGREINTLGSKANDSDIQRLVVLMKDELEKIKEQLFNIL